MFYIFGAVVSNQKFIYYSKAQTWKKIISRVRLWSTRGAVKLLHHFTDTTNINVYLLKANICEHEVNSNICLNCYQLKYLEIGLTEILFEKILEILEYCNNLQELLIYDEHYEFDNYNITSKNLYILT